MRWPLYFRLRHNQLVITCWASLQSATAASDPTPLFRRTMSSGTVQERIAYDRVVALADDGEPHFRRLCMTKTAMRCCWAFTRVNLTTTLLLAGRRSLYFTAVNRPSFMSVGLGVDTNIAIANKVGDVPSFVLRTIKWDDQHN